MRSLKRWWRRLIAEWRIRRRRAEVAEQIRLHLRLGTTPRLVERGNLGHDSNYDVFVGDEQTGVLRLVNPHKRRPTPGADMPFRLAGPEARINREWDAYSKGAGLGLTPSPLWRADDALLCGYLPYGSLRAWIRAEPRRAWDILTLGSLALHRLHRQTGAAHMDASIDNILCDAARSHFVLVDFEYIPADGTSFAQQMIFDHLRLVQSGWRLIDPDIRGDFGGWIAQLASFTDPDMRGASFQPIAPGLQEVLGDAPFSAALREIFDQAP